MLERFIRFQFSFVATLVTLAVVVAVMWGLLGVRPDSVAFWAVLVPLAVFFLGLQAFQGVRRLRGADVTGERHALAHATAAGLRERRGRGKTGG